MLISITLSSKPVFQSNYSLIQKHLNLGETQIQTLMLQHCASPAVSFLFVPLYKLLITLCSAICFCLPLLISDFVQWLTRGE